MPFHGFVVTEVENRIFDWLRAILYREAHPIQDQYNKTYFSEGVLSVFFGKLRRSFGIYCKRYGIFFGCRMPDIHDLWAYSVMKLAEKDKWDIVVSTSGPYSVHYPAFKLRKSGIAHKWIADWRDLWVDNHIFPGIFIFKKIEMIVEKMFCDVADVLTTVSEPLAVKLCNKYKINVHTICNGFDEDCIASIPVDRIFGKDNIFRIVYTGTVYPTWQNPVPLFKALVLLKKKMSITQDQIKVIFAGRNSNIIEVARKESVSEFIDCLGMVHWQDALRMQRDANALLFLEFGAGGNSGILTGKLFEYIVAGPYIMGIGVENESSVGEIFRETGSGIALGNDVEKIADWILLALESRMLPERKKNNPGIAKYSRKAQASRMSKLF